MNNMEWQKLKPITEVWSNDWMKVMEISVRLPTGVETEFYTLDAPDGVAVLVIDEQQRAILNQQYRPALGKVIVELPAGQPENEESYEATASREFTEETGLFVKELHYLGSFYRNPARDTGSMHVYFGRLDEGNTSPCQEPYEYLETIRIPLNDLISQVINNQIQDGTTIFAVLMLYCYLIQGNLKL